MADNIYCYPNSNILINKFNIKESTALFNMERKVTSARLFELQKHPIKGNFDLEHLKDIHRYIFQDMYSWAGQVRTVNIGKENSLFCSFNYIPDYAKTVFNNFFNECYSKRNNFDEFIVSFAENYGNLNALHPFREGNGRAQREFARLVCLECGYIFDLSVTTHTKMLSASKLSLIRGDSSGFIKIFSEAITPYDERSLYGPDKIFILASDDLTIEPKSYSDDYDER